MSSFNYVLVIYYPNFWELLSNYCKRFHSHDEPYCEQFQNRFWSLVNQLTQSCCEAFFTDPCGQTKPILLIYYLLLHRCTHTHKTKHNNTTKPKKRQQKTLKHFFSLATAWIPHQLFLKALYRTEISLIMFFQGSMEDGCLKSFNELATFLLSAFQWYI